MKSKKTQLKLEQLEHAGIERAGQVFRAMLSPKRLAAACPGFRAIGQKCLMFRVKHFGKIDDCAIAPAQAGAIRGRDLAQAEEWVKFYSLVDSSLAPIASSALLR